MCEIYGTIASVCGIAGLFAKSPDFERALGAHLGGMLEQLGDRGPDSAGVALYRDRAERGTKLSLLVTDPTYEWPHLVTDIDDAVGMASVLCDHGDHVVLHTEGDAATALAWLSEWHPEVTVMGSGHAVELHKRIGSPSVLLDECGIRGLEATHGLGHTRMATESLVTTAGSHPFSTGQDLCLVHNGSLSNHNRLRRELRRHGIRFATENDSEVAAGYLAWRLAEGMALDQALEAALEDLDGFFTFAVGTRDGFAVVRDPIACKPAVMAETDEWVAMASEYRAIATLPGAADAEMWEPEPGRIYAWSREEALS